jgi:hypothetical protein
VNEVHSGANADLKDFPLSEGDDALANFPDGRRIAQRTHEMGIDAVPVEGHNQISLPSAANCIPIFP